MKQTFTLLISIATMFCSYASSDWTFVGKSENGSSVFATNAERMNDGSLRMFVKLEQEMERKPEGIFAMFKKPEKYIVTDGPHSVLVHCKKKAIREYKAGTFGSEFYIPWEPVVPGSLGAVAFNAFCKK